jgi:hypothetical protein
VGLESYQIVDLFTTLMIGASVVLLAYSPLPRSLGQALAHRLMHGKAPREPERVTDPRLDDMADEMAMLRRQLEETQGRLDFAERMLSQAKSQAVLPGGRG